MSTNFTDVEEAKRYDDFVELMIKKQKERAEAEEKTSTKDEGFESPVLKDWDSITRNKINELMKVPDEELRFNICDMSIKIAHQHFIEQKTIRLEKQNKVLLEKQALLKSAFAVNCVPILGQEVTTSAPPLEREQSQSDSELSYDHL